MENSKSTNIPNLLDEEDPYLIELHKRYIDMKKERTLAENQSQTLTNRIGLLTREENKSDKQVEDIKSKYKKKLTTMQTIENDLVKKIQIKQLKEEELLKQKEMNRKLKCGLSDKIKRDRENQVKELVEEMVKFKEIKKINEEMQKYLKVEEQHTKINKYEFTKNQKILCIEKKKAQEISKRNQKKTKLEEKIVNEKVNKEKAEEKNQIMGEQEIEIIKRLRTTTKIHENCK